jgi:hypothetical protein
MPVATGDFYVPPAAPPAYTPPDIFSLRI